MRREFRPIDKWPWPLTERRQRSRFELSYSQTLELLDRELRQLDTDTALLCLAVDDSQILVDRSGPYARATPDHPGVMVIAQGTRHGDLRYATDVFRHWSDNLRAIALGLESLRRVDRYGITQAGQQYRGFAALPAPSSGDTAMTADLAEAHLAQLLDLDRHDLLIEYGSRHVRAAKAAAHPDRHSGDHALWDRTTAALAALGVES